MLSMYPTALRSSNHCLRPLLKRPVITSYGASAADSVPQNEHAVSEPARVFGFADDTHAASIKFLKDAVM